MKINRRNILAIVFGLLLLSVQILIEVRQHQTQFAVSPDLERLVEIHPSNWTPINSYITSPAWDKQASREYDSVVARSYQDNHGNIVTIVMTWSRNGLQKAGHIQQLCYSTQGFSINNVKNIDVKLSSKTIPITNFAADRLGGDIEDVYYWRVTGGRLMENIMENRFKNYRLSHRILKLKEVVSHIAGKIPENIMVRVSSIRSEKEQPSFVPIKYVSQYIQLLSPADRKLLLGN